MAAGGRRLDAVVVRSATALAAVKTPPLPSYQAAGPIEGHALAPGAPNSMNRGIGGAAMVPAVDSMPTTRLGFASWAGPGADGCAVDVGMEPPAAATGSRPAPSVAAAVFPRSRAATGSPEAPVPPGAAAGIPSGAPEPHGLATDICGAVFRSPSARSAADPGISPQAGRAVAAAVSSACSMWEAPPHGAGCPARLADANAPDGRMALPADAADPVVRAASSGESAPSTCLPLRIAGRSAARRWWPDAVALQVSRPPWAQTAPDDGAWIRCAGAPPW